MTKMGRSRRTGKAQTLPSSPSHSFSSSSSSDFEFTISLSPRTKSSIETNKNTDHHYCPADELFYKGQLLPLHLSPRLSMVRTLLLASSSTSSSSDTTTTASRDSSGSSNDSHSSFTSADLAVLLPHHPLSSADCDSSRPSSVAEDDEFKRLTNNFQHPSSHLNHHHQQIKKNKYFSLSRFSSVFRKEPKSTAKDAENATNSSVKRMSSSAKDVIRKYMKKVKPLYEKLSQKQQQKMGVVGISTAASSVFALPTKTERSAIKQRETPSSLIQSRNKDNIINNNNNNGGISHSFSGNLRYPRRKSIVSSCPSSMRSSPSHSGVLSKNGFATTTSSTTTSTPTSKIGGGKGTYNKDSSMEELQSAIQGAIAHCKNSMLVQNKSMVSNGCTSSSSSSSNEI